MSTGRYRPAPSSELATVEDREHRGKGVQQIFPICALAGLPELDPTAVHNAAWSANRCPADRPHGIIAGDCVWPAVLPPRATASSRALGSFSVPICTPHGVPRPPTTVAQSLRGGGQIRDLGLRYGCEIAILGDLRSQPPGTGL